MPQTVRIAAGLEGLVGEPLPQEALGTLASASSPGKVVHVPVPLAVAVAASPASIATVPTAVATTPAGIFRLTAVNSPLTPATKVDSGTSAAAAAAAERPPAASVATTPHTPAERQLIDALAEAQHVVALANSNDPPVARVAPVANVQHLAHTNSAPAATPPYLPPIHHVVAAPAMATQPSTVDLPGLQQLMGSQHCMLSYNWNHQATVIETRERLSNLGFNCWLDVDHMKKDIYDSMAEGVQGR